MAIAPELRAQILRLYQAERWRIGTIANQLHLHRDTVQRVIAQACVMRPDAALRPSCRVVLGRHDNTEKIENTGPGTWVTLGSSIENCLCHDEGRGERRRRGPEGPS